MRILVIKQTSLGDVLHSTGHIRTIRENFPDSQITLLTATSSYDIYRHNPHIDNVILFERYRIKSDWYKHPLWAIKHIADVTHQVRLRDYDLAIDLQGRLKSVIFLYAAKAKRKIVKGNWWLLQGFRQRELHAIREMDEVLKKAGLAVNDTRMELHVSSAEQQKVSDLLAEINPVNKKLVILSPFTRWQSKNWPLNHFKQFAQSLPQNMLAAFTGSAADAAPIRELLKSNSGLGINLAGKLNLLEFAELVKRSSVMITGDSFPMHVAGAMGTPIISIFGPTDDSRVGPVGENAIVLRAEDCERCYRRSNCPKRCMKRVSPQQVMESLLRISGSATE